MNRRLVILIVGPLLALLGAGAAWAFWTAPGTGTASASTGTINAPTAAAASTTAGLGTVSVSWTASTVSSSGTSPSGYYVTKVRNSDSVTANACGTSPSFLTTLAACSDTLVADGTYHYVVNAVMATWTAASSSSNNVTVVNDATPPAVSVTSVNGSVRSFPYLTNATATSIGGLCGTATGDSVTVTPLINSAGTLPATAVCSSGSWTLTLTTPYSTDASLTLSATQSDTAGNTGIATAQALTIDKTAPVVSVASVNGSARSFPYSTSANVTSIGGLCGTATGDSAIVTPLINSVGTLPATTTCSSGSWTLTLTTPLSAEATSTLSATQGDAATNTGTASSKAVTIDKTAPVVSVTSVNGSARSFPYSTNVDVASIGGACGTATDDVATVTPLINGIPTAPAATTCSSGIWSLTLTAPLSSEASRSLTANQTDAAGNSGAATPQTFIIDKTVPVLSVTSVNGAVRTFPYSANVNVTSIGGACGVLPGDVTTVTPFISGAATVPATAVCSGGNWILTLTTPLSTDGSRTLTASQADAAGNAGTAISQTIMIDKPPALVTVSSGGGIGGKMELGDSLVLTFSEPLDPTSIPTSVTVTEQRSPGSTTLTIPNLIQVANIGNTYLGANNSSGAATSTSVVLSNGNTTITIILGAVTTTGSGVGTGSGNVVISPSGNLKDLTGNAATSSATVTRLF